MRTMLKSEIHRATVTGADVEREGSVIIDVDLMEAASILPFEQVNVASLQTGVSHQTYAIEGTRGSGTIVLNGAAAKLIARGDVVIITAYDQVAEPETRGWRPTLVYVDEKNQITRVGHEGPVSTR